MTFCSLCWWCTTTLHLSMPAGWEGWGLHQPPRVQNRPSHRVQTEIVSVPHVAQITNQAHLLSPTQHERAQTYCAYVKNTNQSSSPWLTAVPSKPVIPKSRASSSPQIVLRKWTGEWVGVSASLWVCVCVSVWTIVSCWGRHVFFHEYFNWVNQVNTRQQPAQHCAWIRHEPGPLLLNAELCLCVSRVCSCERVIVVIFAGVLSDEL